MKQKRFRVLSLLLAALMLLTACSGGVKVPKELKDYVIPWEVNVVEQAKADGKMHYYFMSGEGGEYEGGDVRNKWGDSCLIVFPDGTTMLMDSGTEPYGKVLTVNLQKLGIEKLDYFVLSHPHSDHYGGALGGGVLDTFGVSEVICSGVNNADWEDPNALEGVCAKYGAKYTILRKGDVVTIGGVTIEALWPQPELVGQMLDNTPDINNSSLVMRFDYGEHSSLFTGDLYLGGERDIMEAQPEKLDVDLLEMCHHGDDTSNHKGFADAVSPEIAVATGYVYVRNQIYANYTAHGGKVLLDMQDGYIHVSAGSDGEMIAETSRQREVNVYEQYEYKG